MAHVNKFYPPLTCLSTNGTSHPVHDITEVLKFGELKAAVCAF